MKHDLNDIEILDLKGSPLSMGADHGEHFRKEIKELYQIRFESMLHYPKETWGIELSESELEKIGNIYFNNMFDYDINGMDEITGLSKGSGLSIGKLMVMQGLTDIRDRKLGIYVGEENNDEGCTSICIDGSKTKSGNMILGQTWDLQTTNMPYVIGVKKTYSNGGLKTFGLTVTGAPTMSGMNNHGICSLTNNVKCVSNRYGIPYLSILNKCLMAKNLPTAISYIEGCVRAGAHYYALSDESEFIGIECTAMRSERQEMKHGKLIHTNHILNPKLSKYEFEDPTWSSIERLRKATRLCNGTKHTLESVKKILSDNSCEENSINRKDYCGVSTNGSIVMMPKERKIIINRGYADTGIWKEIQL
jgi:isopenicillin-N N-acyltransferase-like protein